MLAVRTTTPHARMPLITQTTAADPASSAPVETAGVPLCEKSALGAGLAGGRFVTLVELVPPRSLPRTSSGKLSRTKARNLYLSGEIQPFDIAA